MAKVLVVDDSPMVRKNMKTYLTELGHQVTLSEHGHEAIELLKKEPFSFLFTDIMMPEMDGFEICAEVRANNQFHDLTIIAVSTHQDSKYTSRMLRLGADDYICKPIEKDRLKVVMTRAKIALGGQS